MKKKEHLIIGFGKWGKKIFENIKSKNYYEKIYLKSKSKNLFFYKNQLKKINKINLKKKYYSTHICTPLNKHFIYANKLKVNKLIIEKPTFHTLNSYDKFVYKKSLVATNYSDLYAPGLMSVYKNFLPNQKGKFEIIYRNMTLKYFNKLECLTDWLDHPLSIILYFFKDLGEFRVNKFNRINIKKHICENIVIEFFSNNYKIFIKLETSSYKKKIRLLKIVNSKNHTYNFYQNNYKILQNSKVLKNKKFQDNSTTNVYKKFIMNNKRLIDDDINFSKKIFIIKQNIIKTVKNDFE